MRIGELARQSGVSVSAIKYYTREGMLPPGERTSPNQVAYADTHVRRLRLIRALLEVGGMSVANAREILAEVDAPGTSVHSMLGLAQVAVSHTPDRGDETDRQLAEHEVDALVARHGWVLEKDSSEKANPGWESLVQLVARYRALGQDELLTLLEAYADAAGRLATAELDVVSKMETVDGKVEGALLGTVLGDAAMAALRRIAQEDASRRIAERHTD